MKKEEIEKGKWYWIEYKRKKRGFIGPAKCVKIEEPHKEDHEFAFISPLNEGEEFRRWMYFLPRDVKRECDSLPSYKELVGQILAL